MCKWSIQEQFSLIENVPFRDAKHKTNILIYSSIGKRYIIQISINVGCVVPIHTSRLLNIFTIIWRKEIVHQKTMKLYIVCLSLLAIVGCVSAQDKEPGPAESIWRFLWTPFTALGDFLHGLSTRFDSYFMGGMRGHCGHSTTTPAPSTPSATTIATANG